MPSPPQLWSSCIHRPFPRLQRLLVFDILHRQDEPERTPPTVPLSEEESFHEAPDIPPYTLRPRQPRDIHGPVLRTSRFRNSHVGRRSEERRVGKECRSR